jgi:hypothetical protein
VRNSHRLIFGLVILSVYLWPEVSLGQSASSGLHLITSPIPLSLTVDPGKSVSTELKVRNGGTGPETLKVGLLKFSANGDSGSPKLEDRQPGDDFFNWVTFSEKQFTLAPNEWHTVTMTISPPKTAAFGYYYAATFSRASQTSINPDTPETSLVGATASLILLEVNNPHAKRILTLDSFTVDRPWYEFLPVNFHIKLRNSGNVHVIPHGNIFLTMSGKHDDGSLEVNAGQGNILPGSVRQFTATWQDGFPVYQAAIENGKTIIGKNGTAVQQLNWDFSKVNKLRFGHYTAHLILAYDDGKKDVPIEGSVSFWVIPWRLILASIAIPVIPSVLVFLLMRWRMRRMLRRLHS